MDPGRIPASPAGGELQLKLWIEEIKVWNTTQEHPTILCEPCTASQKRKNIPQQNENRQYGRHYIEHNICPAT